MKTASEITTDEAEFLASLTTDPAWNAARRIGHRYGGLGLSPLLDRLHHEPKETDLAMVDQARAKTAGALAALDALRSKFTN